MTKEKKYEEQLRRLGIWDPAFEPAVHDLCILEREQSRTRKAWKATASPGEAPDVLDPLYDKILKQGTAIQTMRESLGLTPKAMRRFRSNFGQEPGDAEKAKTVLEVIRGKHQQAV